MSGLGLLADYNTSTMNYESAAYHQILTLAANFNTQVIPWNDCKLGDQIGADTSMNIFAGTCKIDGTQFNVAFKLLTTKPSNSPAQEWRYSKILVDIQQELSILNKLKGCPQIIQLLGISFSDFNPVLVLELPEFNLEEYLKDGSIDWDTKLLLASNIAVAIRNIHNAGVIHGDLKAQNVFIKVNGRVLAKVSNFNFGATDLSAQQDRGPGGTDIFRAPECFEVGPKDWDSKMDIYSYGFLVWQIAMNGKIPFEGEGPDEVDVMKRNEIVLPFLIEQLPEDTPEQIKAIIERTVVKDPSKRASIKDILEILNSPEEGQEEDKKIFESWAKDTSPDVRETIWVSELEKLSLPLLLRESIFAKYQKLAKEGDMVALSRLGSCWRSGFGTEKDINKAFECFKEAAATYPPAQTELGFCYSSGQGVKQDPIKAFELFMGAATVANDPLAQYNLGVCYEHGRGVSHDQGEAIRFYEKAAEANISRAQYNLGICYMDGNGVTKNARKAAELFTKAAETDLSSAQCYLGFCYTRGLGVSQDYLKGSQLYKKAALSGNATAQFNLGNMHLQGIGVPHDLEEARRYFEMAAEQKYDEAKDRLDYIDMLEMTQNSLVI